ncbi:trypsin-like peptidase domain-containing protein [Kitasatospora sp. NPDC051853]|uniref:VMAP-C domain-containing protein n=1 Tax=Kitasatospora sp. NPDC051853 TaxID=3364058 RepID=UPI00379BA146
MAYPYWLARIDTGGPEPTVGAGVLVTDRHVLTCAHVVHGHAAVTVRLAHRPDHPALPATVLRRGPWPSGRHGRDGTGDVAVLELAEPVPDRVARPAPFAPLHHWDRPPYPGLTAHGFPFGHDAGRSSEIRPTRAGLLIGGELVQLEHDGQGMPLSPGFSGGPVVDSDTGELVGIVTAAQDTLGRHLPPGPDGRTPPALRIGQMLPAGALARYVPELADLIPGAALPPEQVRELRGLVAGVSASAATGPGPLDPLELYRTATAAQGLLDPPTRPGTLWETCWYLLSEVTGPLTGRHPVREFAALLAESAGDATAEQRDRRHRLLRLADGGIRLVHPGRTAARRWRPILVEIGHSGAGRGRYTVAVRTVRDGEPGPAVPRTLSGGDLQTEVLREIEDQLGRLESDGAELVVFVLPRKLLTVPVHAWTGKHSFGPLGADHPVVVVDRQRRDSAADRRTLELNWALRRDERRTLAHPVDCAEPGEARTLYHLLRPVERPQLPVLPGSPKARRYAPLLDAALGSGVHAVIWPEWTCSERHQPGRACRGRSFTARLAVELAGTPPSELPERIKQLRHQAEEGGDPAGHWAAGLVLLWEDPLLLPSPHRPYPLPPTDPPPQQP